MADFCKQCSEENFNEDFGDFKTSDPEYATNEYVRYVLCEGCGFNCIVDKDGVCISELCDKKHGEVGNAPR